MSDERFRRVRAALRNAATWGAAWAVAGGALMAAVGLFDPDPRIESLPERVGLAIGSGVMWSVRFGIAGAVMGAVFSGVVGLGFRGRRLADLSPARFGLLGAVVGGVGVPLYLQLMNVLSGGGPIAWGLVLDDGPWAAAFGAAAGAGSILLARRAAAPPDGGPDEIQGAPHPGALPEGEFEEIQLPERSRTGAY